MVDIRRYHEISESTHRILNPLSEEKFRLLGEICGLRDGLHQLDLASGKGEMLCQFAARHGSAGVGIDVYEPFVRDARARATELGVEGRVRFEIDDAGRVRDGERYDVVSCIGATWIGGGVAGTLSLMKAVVAAGGWLLVGEPYWIEPPPADRDDEGFSDLAGLLGVFTDAGLTLVEMVLASQDDWDRYSASQWLNVAAWLEANPSSDEAPSVREEFLRSQADYLAWGRRSLGWGVFVLRAFR